MSDLSNASQAASAIRQDLSCVLKEVDYVARHQGDIYYTIDSSEIFPFLFPDYRDSICLLYTSDAADD